MKISLETNQNVCITRQMYEFVEINKLQEISIVALPHYSSVYYETEDGQEIEIGLYTRNGLYNFKVMLQGVERPELGQTNLRDKYALYNALETYLFVQMFVMSNSAIIAPY